MVNVFLDAISYMHLLSQLTSNFNERRYYFGRTAGRMKSRRRILTIGQKSIKLIRQQDVYRLATIIFCTFEKKWHDSRLSCRFIVGGGSIEEQLVNTWGLNYLHTFTVVLSSQWHKPLACTFHAGPPWTNGVRSCSQTCLNNGGPQWQWG